MTKLTTISDSGRVRLGAGMRRVADSGLVRLGAGMRRGATTPVTTAAPTVQAQQPEAVRTAPASVADSGRVRLGAGMRRS